MTLFRIVFALIALHGTSPLYGGQQAAPAFTEKAR
jgi:hypothetical protein